MAVGRLWGRKGLGRVKVRSKITRQYGKHSEYYNQQHVWQKCDGVLCARLGEQMMLCGSGYCCPAAGTATLPLRRCWLLAVFVHDGGETTTTTTTM